MTRWPGGLTFDDEMNARALERAMSTTHGQDHLQALIGIQNWTHRNLAIQGYSLSPVESRRLWVGLRFATGLCLPLVAAAIVIGSPVALVMLAGIAAAAGWTSRHPFDRVWNRASCRASGAPALPPTPRRRRLAFKLGTVWLLATAALFAIGAASAARVVGGLLVLACSLATSLHLCLPSLALELMERMTRHPKPDLTVASASGRLGR
jgi:Domain of unknown function (DUF4395)